MRHLLGLILLPLLAPAAVAQRPPPPVMDGDTLNVVINAIAGLKFDRVRFQAAPGVPIRLTLNNNDVEGDMDHNLVVTRPGARQVVATAGMQTSAEQNYVPRIPQVLVFTPLLKKGNSYVLRFNAPAEPGAYPYVCTFPGHGFVMYGVMYVGQPMPPLAADENVPPSQRTVAVAPLSTREMPGLSFGTTFPAVSRTFMPESGPASIAVGLAPDHGYNFDAGESFLAYAWSGGFVDNQAHWRGNGNAYAQVLGKEYYRSRTGFPFRVGGRETAGHVEFHGYRLVDGGYPEFHYSVDGVRVHELIRSRQDGPGLVRTFRIETSEPVRMLTEAGAGVRFQASAGRWNGSVLELTPAQARQFTLTMIPNAEVAR